MAGRMFCCVMLFVSDAARAGDDTAVPPGREAGEATGRDKSSVTSRRRMLYHLAEGSEIFPLDWLMALKSTKTGKPFLEDPERFGLIQDPEGLEVPGYGRVKLPIGLTVGVPRDVLAAAGTSADPCSDDARQGAELERSCLRSGNSLGPGTVPTRET